MKKFVFVALIGLVIGTAAFAEHPTGLGLGGVFNFGWGQFLDGYHAGYFNPGVSLKVSGIPFYWGIFGNIKHDSMGFGVTGDYYFVDKNFINEDKTNEDGTYRLRLDWYLGAGFFTNVDVWSNWMVFNAGVRVPVGISWYIIKKLELFIGFAPSFGVWIADSRAGLQWLVNQEFGIRYWF